MISRLTKKIVLLLALALMLGVQAASNSSAHLHLNSSSSSSRCDLCFTAHFAVFDAPAVHPFPGPDLLGRTTLQLPFFGYQALFTQPSFSRGPPSLS